MENRHFANMLGKTNRTAKQIEIWDSRILV